MTNWKDFKNWLEREVVISEGLKVQIRPEKQTLYRGLSEIALTNFMDSLEATLDKNDNYHFFPDFAKEQDFDELFSKQAIFGKKTNQEKIKNGDYKGLEKLFNDWKNEKKKVERRQWYEKEYKQVDDFLGLNRDGSRYYVDAEGYVYNDLDIASRVKQKAAETEWLKEQLKQVLGEEQYQAQIEVKYPTKLKEL